MIVKRGPLKVYKDYLKVHVFMLLQWDAAMHQLSLRETSLHTHELDF